MQGTEMRSSNLEKMMQTLVVVLAISLIATVTLGIYSLLSYEKARAIIGETADTYNYLEEDDWYLFSSNKNNDTTAIFFYAENRIDEKAYFYLANMLQRKGYDVFIARSLFHQPLFSVSLIDKARQAYPKYQAWYLGGHGGGADVITRYLLNDNEHQIAGAFYFGAVPDDKVLALQRPLFILLGKNDGVFNWENYYAESYKYFTPLIELQIIEGGNHTNFGYYNLDGHDLAATISPKEQQDIVAQRLSKFIERIQGVR